MNKLEDLLAAKVTSATVVDVAEFSCSTLTLSEPIAEVSQTQSFVSTKLTVTLYYY